MKLKIGFTVEAETLFRMMAKFLPVDNLSIQELGETAAPAAPVPKLSKVAKQVAAGRRGRAAGAGTPFSLTSGANRLIVEVLADGEPHGVSEIKAAMARGDYKVAGSGSALAKLQRRGVIVQPEYGLWRLAESYRKENAA